MKTFQELGLSEGLLAAISAAGFEMPTPVQSRAIPSLLAGRDLVAQARTGTGKTAAFGIPMMERLDPKAKVQALILCPTRELAVQTAGALYTLGNWKGLRVIPIYGGQPIDRQLRALRAGVHIVVATPGRLLDHLRRNTLDVSTIINVVLDEADEMLAMGFIEDIESILEKLPENRQTGLFSATMPPAISRLAQKFLKNPEHLTIEMESHKAPLIRQCYYEVLPGRKLEALERILDMESPGPTIIFCRTRKEASEYAEKLRSRGYLSEGLHGDLGQEDRDRVMGRFRDGTVEMLVATDVAARGLDIENVTHVINLDVPWDGELYTHRIGRTGRAGKAGDALTLIYPRERRQLREIEKSTGIRMSALRIPTAKEIRSRRLETLEKAVRKLMEGPVPAEITAMIPRLLEGSDPAVVVGALLKLTWDAKHAEAEPTDEDLDVASPPETGMTRLFVNVGRMQGVRPADLVGAIANEAGVPGSSIGSIDILENISFFEVPTDKVADVRTALGNTKIRGLKVRIDLAREDRGGRPPPRRGPGGPPGFRPHGPPRSGPGASRPGRWSGPRPHDSGPPQGRPPGRPFKKPFSKPFRKPKTD